VRNGRATHARTLVRAGTRLVCPNPLCRAHVATFRYDVLRGAPGMDPRWFRFEPGQTREVGSPAICFTCTEQVMKAEVGLIDGKSASWFSMHTDNGWIALR